MRYPVSKNINEKYQFLISRLDYYSIWSDNIRQLEAIDSHRSKLFNDISTEIMDEIMIEYNKKST